MSFTKTCINILIHIFYFEASNNDLYTFSYLVVNISFEEARYNINEEDGFIEGCVVLSGLIQREIMIDLLTFDGSAIGG